MEWTTQPFSGTSHTNNCRPFHLWRAEQWCHCGCKHAWLSSFGDASRGSFWAWQESVTRELHLKQICFLPTMLLPTLSHKLFARLNSSCLLTISESQICCKPFRPLPPLRLFKRYTRGSKSYFMGKARQNKTKQNQPTLLSSGSFVRGGREGAHLLLGQLEESWCLNSACWLESQSHSLWSSFVQ